MSIIFLASFSACKPVCKAMRSEMTIPRKHLQGFVSGDRFDLHNIQVGMLKKTATRFMPQIVERKIFNTCTLPCLFHGLRYGP